MLAIYGPIQLILGILTYFMFIQIAMYWMLILGVVSIKKPLVSRIFYVLHILLEPIYRPIRRLVPEKDYVDLAPIIAFIITISLRQYILPAVFGYA
ncbi:MAG: YggT family protein [Aestuariivita sp.]|nr:YggT family protein [Aestuariivita sp.]